MGVVGTAMEMEVSGDLEDVSVVGWGLRMHRTHQNHRGLGHTKQGGARLGCTKQGGLG